MIACPTCKAQNPDGSTFCSTCGNPIASPATYTGADLGGMNTIDPSILPKPGPAQGGEQVALEPGTVFADRYTIEQVVGRGGMGIVYRAKDSIGDRSVALKLIRSDLLGGDAAVKRLVTEGVLTQDIRHKNVVNVYNVGQVDGQPFVAMEFAGGTSLREWFRQQVTARTEVPLRVAARIIAEILDGLEAAHSMGIIHRDLKPENVMLTADPTDKAAPLKILDFGIARAGGKMESGTTTGLGTPRYMAPEQITNPDAAGPSADIYSVSVMFYELLVDVLPQGHWQPPSGGRSDVPPKIDSLIERGLSNRPANRPQTAKEYRQQLVDAVNIRGSYSPPTPPPNDPDAVNGTNLFKQPVVKWTAIGCGGLFVLFLLIGIIGAIGNRNKRSVPPTDVMSADRRADAMEVNAYAPLNGVWRDNFGGVFDVTVGDNGVFSGTGTTPNGGAVNINGQFTGLAGGFKLSGSSNIQGTLQWDGSGCTMQYVMFNSNGTILSQGPMKVNC